MPSGLTQGSGQSGSGQSKGSNIKSGI